MRVAAEVRCEGDPRQRRLERATRAAASAGWRAPARRSGSVPGAPRGHGGPARRADAGRWRPLPGLQPLPPRLVGGPHGAASLGAPRKLAAPSGLAAGRLPARELARRPRSLPGPCPRRRAGRAAADARVPRRRRAPLREAARRPARRRHLAPLALTCTSAASRRWSWRWRHRQRRGSGRSCASSAGATSTTRSSPPTRRCRAATTATAATAGRARSGRWRPGSRACTGYPIVDAGMRQLRPRGLHAQPGSADHRFLPDQGPLPRLARRRLALLGPAGRRRRSPTTPATGSGWRAPATTPGRTGSSTRSARPSASTPTATTCAATCRSWRGIDGKAVHEPWKLGPLERQTLDYPEPIVDHADAAGQFKARRG